MPESYVPPQIEEDNPVFIRHHGEVRFDFVRQMLVELLSFRVENDLNHVQFMGGYALAPFGSQAYPEEHRALLIEWEKQTRRLHWAARELKSLGSDPQKLLVEANYHLGGGTFKHRLFATAFDSWTDMLVWRWLRGRAQCARSVMEFGSIYAPLSDIAFQTYFDLGLTRWPSAFSAAAVDRVLAAYRGGSREQVLDAFAKWYPLAHDYVGARADLAAQCIDMRLWTRGPDQARAGFEEQVAIDLRSLGLSVDLRERACQGGKS